jgi:uncharacterized DUF497 family protein
VYYWADDIIAHLEEHGVNIEDFKAVVSNPQSTTRSKSPGRSMAFGSASDGRLLACVYELEDDDITIIPVIAYYPEN